MIGANESAGLGVPNAGRDGATNSWTHCCSQIDLPYIKNKLDTQIFGWYINTVGDIGQVKKWYWLGVLIVVVVLIRGQMVLS